VSTLRRTLSSGLATAIVNGSPLGVSTRSIPTICDSVPGAGTNPPWPAPTGASKVTIRPPIARSPATTEPLGPRIW
jgi:hypothetical protein